MSEKERLPEEPKTDEARDAHLQSVLAENSRVGALTEGVPGYRPGETAAEAADRVAAEGH